MKILSIDTASNICGVSILDNNNLICNLDSNTGRTHSENLMPFIDLAFKKSNICLKDIDLLVCDKGPGSFTGIRIGIATVMAFKDSLNIPAIGINSLEVLANNISTKGLICSIIDCKNSNCYFALYDLKDEYIELISPKADTIENLCLILKKYYCKNSSLTFVGDGALIYQEVLKSQFPNSIICTTKDSLLNSYKLGLIGLKHYSNNNFSDILPLYLRKPQAERQLENKLKKDL